MKKTTVIMPDDVFKELEVELGLRAACRNLGGIVDEFCALFVKAANEGRRKRKMEIIKKKKGQKP